MALPGLRRQAPVMLVLAVLAGAAAWALAGQLHVSAETTTMAQRLLAALGPLLVAGLAYGIMSWLAGVESARAMLKILRRPTKKG